MLLLVCPSFLTLCHGSVQENTGCVTPALAFGITNEADQPLRPRVALP